MNIDLRNIPEEFELQVEAVKLKYSINTNSKAVEYCTIRYLEQINLVDTLRKELRDEKHKTEQLEYKLKQIKSVFKMILKK